MEFIATSPDMMETAALRGFDSIDVDIGEKNDFELKISKNLVRRYRLEADGFFFRPGTEFGGVLESRETNTKSETVMWKGHTWRGLLDQDVIIPPEGHDHRVASGEANGIIREILAENEAIGTFFVVSQADTGITFTDYQFGRYVTKLTGLSKMLATENMRLSIRAVQGGSGEAFNVMVEAVPIVDWSDLLEYSQDDKVNIKITDHRGGTNHLICLGKGELRDRQRIDLFVWPDGTIRREKFYTGFDERVAVYDFSSAEDNELEEKGRERLEKMMNQQKLEMTIGDFDVEIGDIVGGRDREANILLNQPVTGKILRSSGGNETIQVSVKGGTEKDADL